MSDSETTMLLVYVHASFANVVVYNNGIMASHPSFYSHALLKERIKCFVYLLLFFALFSSISSVILILLRAIITVSAGNRQVIRYSSIVS